MSATNTENWQQGHYAKKQILGVGGLIGWSHRRRFQVALDVARSLQPRTMLDYGCGDGTFLALLRSGANRLERAVGAEIGQSLVDDCRQRLGQDKVLEFVLIPELQQPEHTGRYEAIFCMEVLEHVVDWTPVIEDFARLLRPGGALVISVPVETGPALAVKQIFRRLAALRGHGDYPGSHPYTWGEFFQSVFAGDKQHIVRPVYDAATTKPWHDHKGFNWRVLRNRLQERFELERVFGSPIGFLPMACASQAWLIARRRG